MVVGTNTEILGWILDTHKETMDLIDCKKEQVMQIFADLWDKKHIRMKKWQQMLGELCFMGVAIPGATSLFRAMQLGLNIWKSIKCG